MRKLFIVASGVASFLTIVKPTFAATINLCDTSGTFGKLCSLNFENASTMIKSLIQLSLIAALVISLFFLIYGGIKWVVSGGDKTAVEGARNHIVAAIVGLSIALLAYFIINVVAGIFGIDLKLIKLPVLTP